MSTTIDQKAELRRKQKADYARRHYAEQRAKLGFQVKQRMPPIDKISTTPRKASTAQAGRGRGIVLASPKTARKAPSAEPIIPPGLKITKCPSYEDRRFQPDPDIAGRGAITADWLERQMQERKWNR